MGEQVNMPANPQRTVHLAVHFCPIQGMMQCFLANTQQNDFRPRPFVCGLIATVKLFSSYCSICFPLSSTFSSSSSKVNQFSTLFKPSALSSTLFLSSRWSPAAVPAASSSTVHKR